jgi:predicted dehydrogenase
VIGLFDKDPSFGTDRLASGILDFGNGLQASFTCSTQVAPYQRVNILGTHGRVEIDIPFNAPPDRPCLVSLYPGTHSAQGQFEPTESQVLGMDICDQYTLQGEAISSAILNDEPVPYGLEDTVGNMRTLEALRQSNESSAWLVL